MPYRAVLTDPAERAGRDALVKLWTENLPVRGDADAKLRWFYQDAPGGRGEAFVLRADDDSAIGCAGMSTRELAYDGTITRAALLADFAIDKHHRSGLPALVLQRAVKRHVEASYGLSYGYPNDNAVAIHKRTGYHVLGQMARYVRVLRHGSFIQKRFGWEKRAKIGGAIVDTTMNVAAVARAIPKSRAVALKWVPQFDARWDRLWDRAQADRKLVACPRTAKFLDWRFTRKPDERCAIAALVEKAPGEPLVAYAVVRGGVDEPAEIVDVFGMGPEGLDVLFGQLVPALYARGHTSIEVRYLGHSHLPVILSRHWFSFRNVDRTVIICPTESLSIDRAVVTDPNAWYMTELGRGHMKLSRRTFIAGGIAAALGGTAIVFRHKVASKLKLWTRSKAFTATPPLVAHDPATEKRTVYVAKGATPDGNVDAVLDKVGVDKLVGVNDLVLIKVSAQWWNQGMTNVAAAKRVIERVLARPGFTGEVVVFENTHFRMPDGSGLSRAWTRPSDRNVDVPGMQKLGDLIPFFAGKPVSFVGLVDASASDLGGDDWHDGKHEHGVYGGDDRGPIAAGEIRDGMRWSFDDEFTLKRGWFEHTKVPLTWPVFTSPHSKLQIDLRDGVFAIEGGKRTKVDRKLTWISMVTVNEHSATGMTACCKSAMGIVDMSAGRFGTDPRTEGYNSIHYFGNPEATWRMAGPLAHFATKVRAPDLYLAVAEWVALTPPATVTEWNDEAGDIRLEAVGAHHANTVVAGDDAVAVDWYCAKNILMPIAEKAAARSREQFDLANPDSKLSKFLRYYREVYRKGTLDESLITIA